MAPSQASEPRALAPKKEKAAWVGELTESCRTSRITLPSDLNTDGATAGTSGNASRGNRDSWRTISSLTDGMEHTALGKSLSKSRADDQKGVFWARKLFWKFTSDRQTQPGDDEASSGLVFFFFCWWWWFVCFINLQLYSNENEFHRAATKPWINLKRNCQDERWRHEGTAFLRHPRKKSPVQDGR